MGMPGKDGIQPTTSLCCVLVAGSLHTGLACTLEENVA